MVFIHSQNSWLSSSLTSFLLQVGLLMMLSLLLRAEPAALLLRSQALLDGGKKFSGPNRLPLLLWLINQTARYNDSSV